MDSVFRLDEYHSAATKFALEAISALMDAHDPFLAQIPRRPMEATAGQRLEVGANEEAELPLFDVSSTVTVSNEEAVHARIDQFLASLNSAARESAEKRGRAFFRQLGDFLGKAGQSIDAGGKDLSFDLILDVLDTLAIDFDADGNAVMPQIVVHPDQAAKIAQWPEPTDTQRARLDAIMARKKAEYDAGRRHRKLS